MKWHILFFVALMPGSYSQLFPQNIRVNQVANELTQTIHSVNLTSYIAGYRDETKPKNNIADVKADSLPAKTIHFPFGYTSNTIIPGSKLEVQKTGFYNVSYNLKITVNNNMISPCSSDFILDIFVNGESKLSYSYTFGSAIMDARLNYKTTYWLNKGDSVDLRCNTNVSFWELNTKSARRNSFFLEEKK